MNELVDVIEFRSRTLLSRKAKNTRGVSGMHMCTRRFLLENRLHPPPIYQHFVISAVELSLARVQRSQG